MPAFSKLDVLAAVATRERRAEALWGKLRAAVTLGIELRRLRIDVPPGASPPPLTRQSKFGTPTLVVPLKATGKLRAATASPGRDGGWTLSYNTGVVVPASRLALGTHPLGGGIAKRVRTKGTDGVRNLVYSVGRGPRAPVSVRLVVA